MNLDEHLDLSKTLTFPYKFLLYLNKHVIWIRNRLHRKINIVRVQQTEIFTTIENASGSGKHHAHKKINMGSAQKNSDWEAA
jgi:hypothetical protein